MDLPAPPKDKGLRNIIDKLAEFVARNGPEFEEITKSKQKDNPKFSFLYGGDYYNYYLCKVAEEQASIKGHNSRGRTSNSQQNPQTSIPPLLAGYPTTQIWTSNSQPNPNQANLNAQIENLNLQQNALREQIRLSEQNLQGQHTVLMQQQQNQTDEAIIQAQNELIQNQADNLGISLSEFDTVLQPIIDSCTKDSISAGKSWILQHSSDSAKCNVISKYLLKKALVNGAGFSQKLHLIYLINDVLHHCVRKNNDELKRSLENVVIPMFCSAELISNDDQRCKLHKLLTLWESKANFFDICVMSKLRSPTSSIQEYKTNLLAIHSSVVSVITQTTKQAFENYQQQHQAFIQHASQQIALLETQKQALEQQTLKAMISNVVSPIITSSISETNSLLNNGNILTSSQITPAGTQIRSSSIPSLMDIPISVPTSYNSSNYPQSVNSSQFSGSNINNEESPTEESGMLTEYSLPPPNFQIPDLSKPPPGFAALGTVEAEDLTPYVPYFELPAGLMVPLIRLEDYEYKPLDSTLIKLPPPALPNERLVTAVEAFYSNPNHERPRDGEGWEKLGLYEYYKVKNAAKKQKEEEIEKGIREKSRTPSPIHIEIIRPKSNKRCYRSRSRSKSPSKSRSVSKSPSPSSEIKIIPATPRTQRPQSPLAKRSPSPPQQQLKRNNSPLFRKDRTGGVNNKNEKIGNERERSLSPPSFFGGNYGKAMNDQIEESNKGHQMLMKMGWSGTGTGLGVQGQGIQTPIPSGDARNRNDLYKGVGINLNDPYENFRKNKGAAFITRMKARAEERS